MRRFVPFVLFALLMWAWPASTVAMPDVKAPVAEVAAPADVAPPPADVVPASKDTPTPTTEPAKAAAEPDKAATDLEPKAPDKVPETPEEAGQVLNDLLVALQGGHWAVAVGFALMLIIWVLRRINILTKMPDKAVPWVAAALGIVGYIAVGLSQGMVWHTALVQGFLAGASAVNFWELLFKHLLKKKPAEKPADEEAKDKPAEEEKPSEKGEDKPEEKKPE